MIVGVDVGGTFTDVATWDGTTIHTTKVPTTPDQSDGVIAGARRLVSEADVFVHGTTVATNTLLQRKGARVLLVTDPGFEDVIEIGRQDRPALYDPFAERPIALAPRAGRVSDVAQADLDGIEAVAVVSLRSYEDPGVEQTIRSEIGARRPDLAVCLSSDVSPEFREFERTSTTVLNAYLMPAVASYLEHLGEAVTSGGLADEVVVMRSSGGFITAEEASHLPVSILLSGPAGGAVAAGALADHLGDDQVISFDMGGTSTDVCRIEHGRPEVRFARSVVGYASQMPSASIHTVGAGGGSIGWVDGGGSLRVGPASAGAEPGPACYRKGGTDATVTDANVVLGRIGPNASLGGGLAISRQLARDALARLGSDAALPTDRVALGVVRIVEETMSGAIHTVSIGQGSDPRDARLVAFGGAGGLHATALARSLGMAGVVVPPFGGVFSALGLLLSRPRIDRWRSITIPEGESSRLSAAVATVAEDALSHLPGAAVQTEVDVRYKGQAHEVTVPIAVGESWDDLAERFHQEHRLRNGFNRPDDPIEAVTVRAAAVGRAPLRFDELGEWRAEGDATIGRRSVIDGDGLPVDADVVSRTGLAPGREVVGPAVIEEVQATTFLQAGERARVHDSGTLEVEW